MNSPAIKRILRYPIKGLGADSLPQIDLAASCGMPLDRRYAITYAKSVFDINQPRWVPRRNFLVVAISPQLAQLECKFNADEQLITLLSHGDELATLNLADDEVDRRLNELMEKICADTQAGPYKLVCLPDGSNLTDSPTQTISIMNTQSAAACSKAMGSTIDPRRFRGNIWYEGESAWEENDWVGKELTIAGVNLRVTEPIVRCAAIDASPETGQRDMPLLKSMQRHFGHVHFGVLAEVISGGRVSLGDEINLQAQSSSQSSAQDHSSKAKLAGSEKSPMSSFLDPISGGGDKG